MANKTNPIGVRFDEELLNTVKEAGIATSPQKALNLYERSYLELVDMKVKENNKPENKAKIESERNTVSEVSKTSSGLIVEFKPTYDGPEINDVKDELPKTQTEYSDPKTLDELKKRCPVTLKGLEKSEWIATNRQKYNL